MSIVSLSAMLFMFPFKNSSVFSFSPDDRKWASGAMAVAVVAAATRAAAGKTSAKVDSLLRVTGWLVALFAVLSSTSLILCFSVPFFSFCEGICVSVSGKISLSFS